MSLHILPRESLAIASMFYMKKIQVSNWNDVEDVIGVISSMLHRHVAAVFICVFTVIKCAQHFLTKHHHIN